jgi:von Willebrand factor type A domain
MTKPLALAAALVAALGCGSNARPPTQGSFAPTPDVFAPRDSIPIPDRPTSSCGGTRVSLTQQRAEVVLVIDRSGSMAELDADGNRKWPTLVAVLRDLLPSIEDNVALGLVMFPNTPPPMSSGAAVCGVPAQLQSAPTFRNARTVLDALDAAFPGGGTPTHDAISVAAGYFDNAPDPLGRRYVVLATDGAPNCNLALDPTTCTCAGPAGTCTPSPRSGPITNCLDDTRTVDTIRALATRGIPTFVVGLVGVESFAAVLDAMAVAGGRPRATTPRYYSASDRAALATALRGITTSLLDCRFRLDAPPPDPTLVDVRLGATSLPRDVAHRDGWDWSDDTHLEVAFHGATCDQVRGATGGEVLAAVFGCPAAVPP